MTLSQYFPLDRQGIAGFFKRSMSSWLQFPSSRDVAQGLWKCTGPECHRLRWRRCRRRESLRLRGMPSCDALPACAFRCGAGGLRGLPFLSNETSVTGPWYIYKKHRCESSGRGVILWGLWLGMRYLGSWKFETIPVEQNDCGCLMSLLAIIVVWFILKIIWNQHQHFDFPLDASLSIAPWPTEGSICDCVYRSINRQRDNDIIHCAWHNLNATFRKKKPYSQDGMRDALVGIWAEELETEGILEDGDVPSR